LQYHREEHLTNKAVMNKFKIQRELMVRVA